MRIIDRDIQFYQRQRNRHIGRLGVRTPSEDPIQRASIEKVELVIHALKVYRDLLDKDNTGNTETEQS